MVDQELQDALKPIEPPSESRRKGRARAASKPKTSSGKSMTLPQLQAGLRSSFELLGLGLMAVDHFDGQIIVDKSGDMAEALIELAKVNPGVRRMLESLVGVGAWSGVVTVFGAQVALPIAVHHNLLPEPVNTMLAESGDIPVKPRKGKLRVIDGENEGNTEGANNGQEAQE